MTLELIKINGVPDHMIYKVEGGTVVIPLSEMDAAMSELLDTRTKMIKEDRTAMRKEYGYHGKRLIAGRLNIGPDKDASDILRVDNTPLAEACSAWGEVTVHYWVTSMPKGKAELAVDTFKKMHGDCDQRYYHRYSDLTGYLWTEEDLKIGGHDLLKELRGEVGNYLYMEMEVHK